ncbi:MAG: TldD/PmbA family protein, partial [Bacteroidota bacterium]
MEKNYDRRTFLKTGSIAVAGTMVLPTFLKGCGNMAHGTSPLSYQLNDYLSHFGVTREMIMKVVGEGLSRGGDYCDLYFQHHNRNSVSLEDNTVNRAYSNVSFGVGIRVLSGEQTGYSFTEEISLESMKSAARTAANIADANPKVKVMPLSEKQLPSYYPINQAWEEVSITDKIPFLQKINEKTFALDPRVIKTNVSFSDETSYVLFANSEGVIACDYQPMSQLSAYCVAEENNRKEENGYSISSRRGFDFFTPVVIDDIATRAVNNTILLFESVVPKAGEMPVVLGAGSSGILLHEAIGHGMEADFSWLNHPFDSLK